LQWGVARAAVPPGLDELAARLHRVAAEVDSALDELLDFARGIHPRILDQGRPRTGGGYPRSPLAIAVALDVRTDAPLPEQIEATAYYVVAEALTNIAKHAGARPQQEPTECRRECPVHAIAIVRLRTPRHDPLAKRRRSSG
jgi:signal transduction histidine kinase